MAVIDLSFTLSDLEFFLLIFVRITCFIYACPNMSNGNVPNQYKIALGFFLSFLTYSFVEPTSLVSYSSVMEYAVIVAKEAVVGLCIGLAATICTNIVTFAGRIMDTEMGLSMATVYDPTTRENVSLSGTFYNYLVTIILMISGMYRYLMSAIIETFELIPVNGENIAMGKLLNSFVGFMSDFFSVGFKICLPVFAAIMLLNAVLGILAKVSPQLNMFAVGHQLKILTGLAIMFLTINVLPAVSDYIYSEMKKTVVSFVEAMM